MSKKLFGDLTFGTRFTFYGKTYIKIAQGGWTKILFVHPPGVFS